MHPIYASLQASSPSTVGAFLHQAFNEVKKLLQQGIDTEEERQNIVTAVMKYYDEHINELVPAAMQASIRDGMSKGITAALLAASTI